jgi:hypothetical protein
VTDALPIFPATARPLAARHGPTGLDAPRRVAVFRALQLGDMLCAVPALRALRRLWPRAHITLVGLPWAADFARRFTHLVDAFLPFPGHPGLPEQAPDPAAWPAFIAAARAADFDLTLQLHGDGRLSNAVVSNIPAAARAGFVPADAADEPEGRFVAWPDRGPELRRLLALPLALGAEAASEELAFPLLPADLAEWHAWPGVRRLLGPQGERAADYLCVHVGARAAGRRWPLGHFAQVADTLAAATGWRVVLTGSAAERPLTAACARLMHKDSIDAAAPVGVGALAALIGQARLLVSNDTGVSHIAAALRTPSVVVFRASDMERWAPLDRQRHRCVWDPEGGRVDEVLAEARSLLSS